MKNLVFSLFLLLFWSAAIAQKLETHSFPGFQNVQIYKPSGGAAGASAVVLFLSGDGGWEARVEAMANALAKEGAVVAGIHLPKYFKRIAAEPKKNCFYPAGDLEELAQTVEKFVGLTDYRTPILAGFSSGATVVYTALAQAPEGTFAGGLSMGFCPDLEILKEPCQQNGLKCHRISKPVAAWLLEPEPTLKASWIALHGEIDQCCTFESAQNFLEKIPSAQLVGLPKVGHGFAVPKNWLPQFQRAFEQLISGKTASTKPQPTGKQRFQPAFKADEVSDLPLAETPATSGSSEKMAIFISGDGGWKSFNQAISDDLAAKGIPVVGLNALKYFWNEKTPETAAADLTRILHFYQEKWGKKEVVLIGYSFGAAVEPFLFNLLNDADKHSVAGQILLSPDDVADFTFHFGSWVGKSSSKALPVKPELEKMQNYRVLFVHGSDEDAAWLEPLAQGNFQLKTLGKGHKYGGDTTDLTQLFFDFLNAGSKRKN